MTTFCCHHQASCSSGTAVFKVLSVWSPQAKNRPRSLLFLSLPQHQLGGDWFFAWCLTHDRMFWPISGVFIYWKCLLWSRVIGFTRFGEEVACSWNKACACFLLRLMPRRLHWRSLVKDMAQALVPRRTNQIWEFVLRWKDQVFHIWLKNATEFYIVWNQKAVLWGFFS